MNERLETSAPIKSNKNLACFFKGVQVDYRMDWVRNSIHYVRENWNDNTWHERMLDKLYEEFHISIDRSILRQKNWIDEENVPEINKTNFDLLRYYTTNEGYEKLKNMNEAFRDKELNFDNCNAATYLIELMNIELYNFISTNPENSNFEGTIYRGFLPTTPEAYDVFEKDLKEKETCPISARQIAIPLEFMSASLDINRALYYSAKDKSSINQTPIMLEIKVRNLDKSFVEKYHRFYPDSPVTSLCAVPIEDISAKPEDKEVLLRGAFFQILKTHLNENPVRIEVLMLSANRDHIKTQKYKDTNAQNLFRSLVKQDKMRICKELADNEKDRKEYAAAEELAKQEVEKNIEISRKETIKRLQTSIKTYDDLISTIENQI